MAKKIGNMLVAGVIGGFVMLFFGSFLFAADEVTSTNNDKIGAEVLGIGEDNTNNFRDTEIALQENTFETGVFALPENQRVETRGISQGNIISKDSPANAKQSLTAFGKQTNIPGIVMGLVISLLTLTGILLLIRVFRGDGAT